MHRTLAAVKRRSAGVVNGVAIESLPIERDPTPGEPQCPAPETLAMKGDFSRFLFGSEWG